MPPGPSSLPARLRHVRESLGLTRAAFAQELGVTRISVSRYELGRQVPGVGVLVKIAERGGVTVDWLLTGTDGDSRQPRGPDDWAATVAALHQVWRDPTQRAAVRAALEAWARGIGSLSPKV